MHVLIPFDIVPVSERVPFGVAPASERAVRYALDAFGPDDVRITAVHLAQAGDELPADIGASEIESMAAQRDISVRTHVQTLADADSMEAIRQAILGIVAESDVDVVVLGYEERSFADSVFHESTADRVLETHEIPVTLVP